MAIDTQNTWVATDEPVTFQDVLDYEQGLSIKGQDKFLEREDQKDLSQQKAVQKLKAEWLHKVEQIIKEFMQIEYDKKKGVTKKRHFNVYSKITTHKLADIAISVMLDATQRNWSLRHTEEQMGAAVGVLLFDATMRKTSRGRRKMDRLGEKVASQRGFDIAGRRDAILQFAQKHGHDGDMWRVDNTDKEAKSNLSIHGRPLIEAVLHEEALGHVFLTQKEKREADANLTYYVSLKTDISKEISEVRLLLSTYNSHLGPMIMPPYKWSKDTLGPYARQEINLIVPMVRNMGQEQRAAISKGLRSGELDDVCEAMNFIQETPYRVNSYVFDALKWVYDDMDKETGESALAEQIKGFPKTRRIEYAADDKLPPEEFAALKKQDQILKARALANKKRYNLGAKGAREMLPRMIGHAMSVMPYDRFWLPHNLDWRGRIYPVPDFSPQNVDYVRAMFEFANRTLIDEDSELFLKLQIANTGGQDKEPLDKRMQWVDDNEKQILAAGEDFKTTVDFWGSQDKSSFQFLAACREWYRYKQAKDAGEPFYSGLPVGMDATQSGVQHYSAANLSLDEGEKVNLVQGERPTDFYKLCLNTAIEILEEDEKALLKYIEENPRNANDDKVILDYEAAQEGVGLEPYPELSEEERADQHQKDMKRKRDAFKQTKAYQKLMKLKDLEACQTALRLYKETEQAKKDGLPKPLASYGRSEMKRNAMTLCYSSTEFGMADQLFDDWMKPLAALVFEGKLDSHPFGQDDGFHASRYIARVHYNAICGEVKSAKDGMDFFVDVAANLASDEHRILDEKEGPVATHIKFVNKVNFPMIQDYRKLARTRGFNKVLTHDVEVREWNTEAKSTFPQYTNKVSLKDTVNGSAPNVIHSQDSCHLMMSVLDFKNDEGGISFMGIHDSFSTTAAEGAMLARSLRRAFINLYKDYNLYEDFLAQSKARHSDPENVKWRKPPTQGKLDIESVWFSDYFFS